MRGVDFLSRLLDGSEVVWKPLKEVLVRTKGTKITAGRMKEIHKDGAPIKIFAGGKTFAFVDYGDIPAGDVNTEPSIIVKSRGIIEFEYCEKAFSHKNEMWSYHSTESSISIKYVYHYLKLNEFHFQNIGGKMQMPQIATPDTDKFPIPIPCPDNPDKSFAIQAEIVRILDTFTALTTELEAELTARKKQYEHYREELLTFGDDVEFRALGEVGSIYDGTHQTPEYTDEGVKFVSVENIKSLYTTTKYISKEDFNCNYKIKPQTNDLFMTRIGSIGACTVVDRDDALAFYVTLALIRPHQTKINSRYIKFILESRTGKVELRKKTLVNAVPIKINLGDIGKIKIPIPPLSKQKEIVAILDKFDALVNDISTGLPREIELRQKQYAYYRDLLLSFPKPEAELARKA